MTEAEKDKYKTLCTGQGKAIVFLAPNPAAYVLAEITTF
jgi:hypothetical protein